MRATKKISIHEKINVRGALARKGLRGTEVIKSDARNLLHYWGRCFGYRQLIANAHRFV